MHQEFHDVFFDLDDQAPLTFEGTTVDNHWQDGRLLVETSDISIEVTDGIPFFVGAEKDPWGDDKAVEQYFARMNRTPQQIIENNYETAINDANRKTQFISELTEITGEGGRILEISCGHGGGFAPWILETDPGAVLLMSDLGRWVVKGWHHLSRQHDWSKVSFAQFEPIRLPIISGSFRAITSLGGFSNATVGSPALKEVHRILEPGGRLFILDARPDPTTYRKFPDEVRQKLKAKYPAMGVGYNKLLNSVGFTAASYEETTRRPLGASESMVAQAARKYNVNMDIVICKVLARKDR